MEQRIAGKNQMAVDKKPKDLLRAIGKIESDDWNIKQIEKKIEESKKTEVAKSREKVPKWSKEQFLQRQNKLTAQDDDGSDERFKEIDTTIKALDKQLKEGSIRELGERGKNKVASIAGNFAKIEETSAGDEKLQRSVCLNSSLCAVRCALVCSKSILTIFIQFINFRAQKSVWCSIYRRTLIVVTFASKRFT